MTHYSVWNYDTKRYDYYVDGARGGTHAGTPPKARGPKSGLGTTPDQSAWPLPASAQKVGSGATAKGRIASLGDFTDTTSTLVTVGIVAAGLYFLFKKGR